MVHARTLSPLARLLQKYFAVELYALGAQIDIVLTKVRPRRRMDTQQALPGDVIHLTMMQLINELESAHRRIVANQSSTKPVPIRAIAEIADATRKVLDKLSIAGVDGVYVEYVHPDGRWLLPAPTRAQMSDAKAPEALHLKINARIRGVARDWDDRSHLVQLDDLTWLAPPSDLLLDAAIATLHKQTWLVATATRIDDAWHIDPGWTLIQQDNLVD